MLGGSGKILQLLVEHGQVDVPGRCHKDLVVLGAAHLALLLVHHQLLVELLARAQAHDLDLHIHARLVTVKADELLGQIHDLDRLAHVQHIDAAALGQRARLQHQLGRLGNGHKVALDVGVSQGDGAALLDLSLEQRDHTAVAAQHVAKADRHALHVGVARKGLDEHLTDPLGAAHHAGGIDRLVGGKLDEPLHVVLAGAGEQVLGAQHVVLHGLGGADLHQRHMLVGRCMEHHSGVVGLKHLVQPLFIPDGADQHGHRDVAAVLLLQFHQQLVGAVLVDIKDQQLAGPEAHHLAAELAANGAAAARHQHGLAGEVAGDLLVVQRDLITGEEIGGVQLTERTLLGAVAAHQLGVAQDLHRAVGGNAEVDDMVQPAAPQGGDGNDDVVDVVLGAELGDLLQRALDRHAVDGLPLLDQVIVHRHNGVAVAAVGFADIDGPGTGLARAHDHHGAVGILVGHAPQPLADGMVQEEPPCQTAAAHQQEDEDSGHGVGRIEQHAVDTEMVHEIDHPRGHGDHAAQTDEVTLPGILPEHMVQPARQKAEQVERHDPGQVLVEQGTVVGPPTGLHRAVGPEQQGKVKAEYHDGRVQQHQDHPAQQHLRHKLLCFLHKNPLLHRGGICPHSFFPALPAAGAKAPCACSAIISIVLYSILPPVSRTIPILRAFLPLPAGFFCPQDGPHLFAQPQRPLHGKADCRHAKAARTKRRQPGGHAPAAQPPRQQRAQALARPR